MIYELIKKKGWKSVGLEGLCLYLDIQKSEIIEIIKNDRRLLFDGKTSVKIADKNTEYNILSDEDKKYIKGKYEKMLLTYKLFDKVTDGKANFEDMVYMLMGQNYRINKNEFLTLCDFESAYMLLYDRYKHIHNKTLMDKAKDVYKLNNSLINMSVLNKLGLKFVDKEHMIDSLDRIGVKVSFHNKNFRLFVL